MPDATPPKPSTMTVDQTGLPVPADAPPIVTPFYLDKALWLVFLTPLCTFVSAKLGINMTAGDIAALALPVATYVVMHKWKTAKLQAAQIGAAAAAAVTSDADAVAVLAGRK